MMAAKVALGNGYLNTGNPAIFTEIFIAAFRKGHSQLKSFIRCVTISLRRQQR
jgi:peroxidase